MADQNYPFLCLVLSSESKDTVVAKLNKLATFKGPRTFSWQNLGFSPFELLALLIIETLLLQARAFYMVQQQAVKVKFPHHPNSSFREVTPTIHFIPRRIPLLDHLLGVFFGIYEGELTYRGEDVEPVMKKIVDDWMRMKAIQNLSSDSMNAAQLMPSLVPPDSGPHSGASGSTNTPAISNFTAAQCSIATSLSNLGPAKGQPPGQMSTQGSTSHLGKQRRNGQSISTFTPPTPASMTQNQYPTIDQSRSIWFYPRSSTNFRSHLPVPYSLSQTSYASCSHTVTLAPATSAVLPERDRELTWDGRRRNILAEKRAAMEYHSQNPTPVLLFGSEEHKEKFKKAQQQATKFYEDPVFLTIKPFLSGILFDPDQVTAPIPQLKKKKLFRLQTQTLHSIWAATAGVEGEVWRKDKTNNDFMNEWRMKKEALDEEILFQLQNGYIIGDVEKKTKEKITEREIGPSAKRAKSMSPLISPISGPISAATSSGPTNIPAFSTSPICQAPPHAHFEPLPAATSSVTSRIEERRIRLKEKRRLLERFVEIKTPGTKAHHDMFILAQERATEFYEDPKFLVMKSYLSEILFDPDQVTAPIPQFKRRNLFAVKGQQLYQEWANASGVKKEIWIMDQANKDFMEEWTERATILDKEILFQIDKGFITGNLKREAYAPRKRTGDGKAGPSAKRAKNFVEVVTLEDNMDE